MIPVFRPHYGEEEIAAVREVFASGWIGQGVKTAAFEKAFSRHMGGAEVVGVNSCSSALALSVKLLDLTPGDEILVPALTFIACGHAVAMAGGTPVFCDVDPETLCVTPEEIARRRTPRTRAAMVVHYAGRPAPMEEILVVAKGLEVIEDAAHAVASTYKGRPCGTIGSLGCHSFDAVKVIATPDAGAVVTKDPERAARAKRLRYLGIDKTTYEGLDSGKARWWEYEVGEVFFKCQMNDVAAALALVQLAKLPAALARRRAIAARYDEALRDLAWLRTPPPETEELKSSFFIYWLRVPDGRRDDLARHILARDIFCTIQYHPNHLFQCYGPPEHRLPVAERAAEEILTIPLHPALSDAEVERIVETVRSFPA